MREVGKAAGWTLLSHRGYYYIRVEEVVAFLSNSVEARAVLAKMLEDSPLGDDEEE